jgi:hypothetical protein
MQPSSKLLRIEERELLIALLRLLLGINWMSTAAGKHHNKGNMGRLAEAC